MTTIDEIADPTLKALAILLRFRIHELRSKNVSDQNIFCRIDISPAIEILSKQAPNALESILKG